MPMLFSMLETYDHLHADGPATNMCNKIGETIHKNVTVIQNTTTPDIPQCSEVSIIFTINSDKLIR